MSDITANVVVSMPSQLFTAARSFKALANGKIYIGKIDTDPTIPENQIQVYIENEEGSLVPVPQPIVINAGGFPVYNGQVVKFVAKDSHSMAVYDSYNAQQFYFNKRSQYTLGSFIDDLANIDSNVLIAGIKAKDISFTTSLSKNLNTATKIMTSSIPENIGIINTSGYDNVFGIADFWVRSSEKTYPGQSPTQLRKLAVSDSDGFIWNLDISSGVICIDSLGAKGNGNDDDWDILELCLKNAEQGSNRTVKGISNKYYFSKPILLRSGRHLDFDAKFGLDIVYGGGVLSESEAPNAKTPIGNQTSVFSGKKAQIIVAHKDNDYARFFSIKNCYILNKDNATSDYGIYCPFGNAFDIENVWLKGAMIGFDTRNVYTFSVKGCNLAAPDGVMGTVGFNITPIVNNLGAGTSGTFERVGISGYRFSWYINELNYSVFNACYSEINLTRYAWHLQRCNGIVINAYGIENLTTVSGDGRLMDIIDSQVTVNGLQASYNNNLTGVSAVTISGNSQVTINDPFFVTVGGAYVPFQTDSSSRVRVFGFKYSGVTPSANALGTQTVIYGEQGKVEAANFPGNWNGGLIRVGNVRLWDDGTGLRIKRGSDPTNVSDGTPL